MANSAARWYDAGESGAKNVDVRPRQSIQRSVENLHRSPRPDWIGIGKNRSSIGGATPVRFALRPSALHVGRHHQTLGEGPSDPWSR